MIRVKNLRKLYDDFLAVDGISFELSPGQICGLVGANGAGKTTTMRCIAGLIPATAGQMQVADVEVDTESIELKRRLAYVPDDPPLFDDLTVVDHLHFIGRLYGLNNYVERADELIEQFSLSKKRDAGATTLSRGMRQKLAIACAYLHQPNVLLLDEPLTGLDPPGIRVLLNSIRDRAAAGSTVIISSHLLAMIESVCTDVMLMSDGKVVSFDSAQAIRARHPGSASLESAYFASVADTPMHATEAGA